MLVSVAMRTWPQQWPDFRSFLQSLFQSSSQLAPIEVALLTIKNFAEDIFIYDNSHIDDSRLQELKAALIAEAPAFLALVADYMKKLAPLLSSTASPTTPSQSQIQQTVFIEAIHVWTAYVEWAPFQYI